MGYVVLGVISTIFVLLLILAAGQSQEGEEPTPEEHWNERDQE